ncbi:tRNA uridine-5-carboxymethylaminomethyl(34) synthesis GTPase MnmE [Chthonobacter albigriseus]|uniref:tRNA uridine-5-carboxymethylaminomethyl(34) synthesis GTPase MnmE n=1 Tax=Chthonobacter albigriseus TaxID=1683161 RepID=UPI0015EEAFCE|nr:tRNA uridine-5-carboxymethylaminomethyl(34) synthesis GTPase MnmE [Chthonobacter albigriseus]
MSEGTPGQVGASGGGRDTIVALASGHPPAGVAVIRVSGPSTGSAIARVVRTVPTARRVSFRAIRDPDTGEVIDRGIVFLMPGPGTFTGEDTAEIQVHGSRAVVQKILAVLASLPGCRLAEAGEFTRRAFENGRLDLTAVEGLADLIAAETDAQRIQALAQADGGLARSALDWRTRILEARALLEAHIDFSDEEDAAGADLSPVDAALGSIAREMAEAISGSRRGERVRDGFQVALMGAPNSGKSSLINALSERDVAIVSDVPGTTRDLLEVHLDLRGEAVVLFDTAGLRDTADSVEQEGIRRAVDRARRADLVLWLDPEGRTPPDHVARLGPPVRLLRTKSDLHPGRAGDGLAVSAVTPGGLDLLIAELVAQASVGARGEPALVTRARQKTCVAAALEAVSAAQRSGLPLEIRADHLRRASEAIGRLVGRTDVEDVLGAIFSRFCIGK